MHGADRVAVVILVQLVADTGHKHVTKGVSSHPCEFFYCRLLGEKVGIGQGLKLTLGYLCRVHLACPVGQVVCLVYKKGEVATRVKKSPYINHGIEQVIDVADHHVTKLRIGKRKLVRTYGIFARDIPKLLKGYDGLSFIVKGKHRIG